MLNILFLTFKLIKIIKKVLAIICYLYYNYAGKGKVYVKEKNNVKNISKW